MGEPRLPHFIVRREKPPAQPRRSQAALSRLACTVVLGLAALPAWACDRIEIHGILAARFADSMVTFRSRLDYAPSNPESSARVQLRRRNLACDLVLAAPTESPADPLECVPPTASGKLSCDDGREWRLEWRMTSNRGGLGYSTNDDLPAFTFGFSSYLDGALDQLDKAREGRRE
ncbi:MAG: hypothetical protein KGN39_08265 [Betaproteobacteria bacterium]|nr:hypothetical protein [Betaproteobacteria bacterium]